jgi:penicillin-binding protein 2
VVKQASQAQALAIMENGDAYPGIAAITAPLRGYPSFAGENGAHVLGYVGGVSDANLADPNHKYYREENIGKTGLEYVYDSYLRGTPGIKTVTVDRRERVTKIVKNTLPVPGDNLVTNINAKLQAVSEQALADAVRSARAQGYHGDSGAVIVMNVKTGGVLAMASWPTYDPSVWQKGLTPAAAAAMFSDKAGVPALSRAIQGTYAPASTFKSLSIAAAAKAGYSLAPNTLYNCPSTVKIGNQVFKNFEAKNEGMINMQKAIAVSCDTLWYQIAYNEWVKDGGLRVRSRNTPNDYFFNNAAAFGVGKATGIDLPSEASGRLPDRQWKLNFYKTNKNFWCNYTSRARPADLTTYLIAIAKENCTDGYIVRAGDAVNFAIGQGDTLVTPLQLTDIYSAIANGGTLYKPEVAKAIVSVSNQVVHRFDPVINGRIPASSSTIEFLHGALRQVATVGTAAPIFANFPIEVSGKTGTGQVQGKNPDGSSKDDTSWFASFAPSASPKYAVVMMVSQGGFGASTSAVGVRTIYSSIFGVVGNKVDPTKAIFPIGGPSSQIPHLDPKNAAKVKP